MLNTAVLLLLVACKSDFPDLAGIQESTSTATATLPALRIVASNPTAVTQTATATATIPTPSATALPATEMVAPSATIPPAETAAATETAQPTETVLPTETTEPSPSAPPVVTPLPAEPPPVAEGQVTVNGIARQDIAVMPEGVRQHVREIFVLGQSYGRDPRAFSKLGDSVTLTDHYMTRFDSGHYALGEYEHLQAAIDHYSGSFSRYGVATRVGLHAWSIFDPLWANKEWCLPDEHMVACEIRLFNPSVLLVKIGSNDSGAASSFDENMRQMVEFAIENGVIPILGTKADRFEGPDDRNNRMIRQIAEDYQIPLWDYDLVAGTLPRRGLGGDEVHMTMADADDYTNPETFKRGYPVSDLTALMTLYEVLQEVTAAGGA